MIEKSQAQPQTIFILKKTSFLKSLFILFLCLFFSFSFVCVWGCIFFSHCLRFSFRMNSCSHMICTVCVSVRFLLLVLLIRHSPSYVFQHPSTPSPAVFVACCLVDHTLSPAVFSSAINHKFAHVMSTQLIKFAHSFFTQKRKSNLASLSYVDLD